MRARLTYLHPQPPFPLSESESRVRSRFLEACAHNQRAKLSFGLDRSTHYARKVMLALQAWAADSEGRVLRVASVATLASDGHERVLVGLVLAAEPHIGLHLPLSAAHLTRLSSATVHSGGAA